jgi:hypothetical protein
VTRVCQELVVGYGGDVCGGDLFLPPGTYVTQEEFCFGRSEPLLSVFVLYGKSEEPLFQRWQRTEELSDMVNAFLLSVCRPDSFRFLGFTLSSPPQHACLCFILQAAHLPLLQNARNGQVVLIILGLLHVLVPLTRSLPVAG